MTYQPPQLYSQPTPPPSPANHAPAPRPRRWGWAILAVALVLGALLVWLAGDRILNVYRGQLAPLTGAAWQEFTLSDGSASLSFPGKVTRVPVPEGATKGFTMEVYQSVSLSSESRLIVYTYPKPLTNTTAVYDAVIAKLPESGLGQKVVSQQRITLDGREGREVKLESSRGMVTLRLVVAGDRLYNLIFLERKADGAAAARDRFLGSLRIRR